MDSYEAYNSVISEDDRQGSMIGKLGYPSCAYIGNLDVGMDGSLPRQPQRASGTFFSLSAAIAARRHGSPQLQFFELQSFRHFEEDVRARTDRGP